MLPNTMDSSSKKEKINFILQHEHPNTVVVAQRNKRLILSFKYPNRFTACAQLIVSIPAGFLTR
jgi:hypothetical protein